VDETRSMVRFAPHLAWKNERLRDRLEERLAIDCFIENDNTAAAWAEYLFGAGVDRPDMVLVGLGTGIGGGLIIDGRLYRGEYGIAGEFGHMRVVVDGVGCECGRVGCWEQYASGNALVRNTKEAAAAALARAAKLLSLGDGSVAGITGPQITEAAKKGDEFSREMLAEVGRWLGQGLASLTAVLDPAIYVIGGGLSDAGDYLLEPAREVHRRETVGAGARPVAAIVPALLGNEAGLVGVADIARRAWAGADPDLPRKLRVGDGALGVHVRVSAQDLARRVKTRFERKRRGLHGAVITDDDR
jgi:glucokinase